MALQTSTSKARERTMSTGGNGRAAFWLEVGSRVVMHSEYSSASGGGTGGGGWQRCATSGCLGSVVGASDRCFVHAADSERASHLQEVSLGLRSLDLRGAEVDDGLWHSTLERLSVSPDLINVSIDCGGAVFASKMRMQGLTFEKYVGFFGTIFDDGCEIRNCSFNGGLDVRYTNFRLGPGYFPNCNITTLYASYCHTQQHVAFVSCELTDSVTAEGVQKDFRLEGCHLYKSCDISRADVDVLMLTGSRFDGDLKVTDVNAMSFMAAGIEISAPCTIGPLEIAGAVDLSNSSFKRQIRLIVSASTLNAADSSFGGGGRIDCKKAKIDLSRLAVSAPLLVIGSDGAATLSIQDADCGHLRLSSLNLSNCHFYGCHDLQGIILESTNSLPDAPRPLRSRRKCIADEFSWRETNTRWRKADWSKKRDNKERQALGMSAIAASPLAPAQIADVYRSLRTSVEARSNEPGAADFYYGEMEMRRLDRTTSLWDRLIVWTYWLISGYGLRALRSMFCLLCVFLAGSVLIRNFGLKKSHSWPTSFVASGQSLVPGLSVSANLTSNGEAIQIALRIMGPVLLGLALLALRNRIRR